MTRIFLTMLFSFLMFVSLDILVPNGNWLWLTTLVISTVGLSVVTMVAWLSTDKDRLF